jgi:hypothetical protein
MPGLRYREFSFRLLDSKLYSYGLKVKAARDAYAHAGVRLTSCQELRQAGRETLCCCIGPARRNAWRCFMAKLNYLSFPEDIRRSPRTQLVVLGLVKTKKEHQSPHPWPSVAINHPTSPLSQAGLFVPSFYGDQCAPLFLNKDAIDTGKVEGRSRRTHPLQSRATSSRTRR